MSDYTEWPLVEEQTRDIIERLHEAARVLRERAEAAEHKRKWRTTMTTKVVGVVTNGAYGGEFTSRPMSQARRDAVANLILATATQG